jgi:hypothetical protein
LSGFHRLACESVCVVLVPVAAWSLGPLWIGESSVTDLAQTNGRRDQHARQALGVTPAEAGVQCLTIFDFPPQPGSTHAAAFREQGGWFGVRAPGSRPAVFVPLHGASHFPLRGHEKSNHCAAGAARTAKPARRAEGRMLGVKRRSPRLALAGLRAASPSRGRAFRQHIGQLLLRCLNSGIHVLATSMPVAQPDDIDSPSHGAPG